MEQKILIEKIQRLRREKDVFILAHNYQIPEIQDIADFTGDSLAMAQKATRVGNSAMVVCGVYFMAETAAILNPEKTVLIPDMAAGCPLANFAPAAMVREWRERYPDRAFVAYINSSAETKALVDICCTSSNAVQVVNSVQNDKIVFLPDKNLGAYVKSQTSKDIVLWPGFCVVHEKADLEAVVNAKKEYPSALTMVHPECPSEFLELADGICSTGQMIGFVDKHPDTKEFMVVTECGMVYALKKHFPERTFIEPSTRMECRNMKKITLEKLAAVLENFDKKVTVDPAIADKARITIEKMLKVTL